MKPIGAARGYVQYTAGRGTGKAGKHAVTTVADGKIRNSEKQFGKNGGNDSSPDPLDRFPVLHHLHLHTSQTTVQSMDLAILTEVPRSGFSAQLPRLTATK
jgi:hypothetical protein